MPQRYFLFYYLLIISQFSRSAVSDSATPWTAAQQASVSISNSWSFLKLMPVKLVMPANHIILCNPPFLLPSVFPRFRVFSNESVLCIRWPKYCSFSFSISSSNEYSGLIFFTTDWCDLLADQGTLRRLLQHHSSKASILWCSVFFTIQLLHPHMTTGKTIVLTRWTFVGKVMSLLFNMLSWFVTDFFPKEWSSFTFKAAVTICSDFGAQENEICHCFHCFLIYLLWTDGTGCNHAWFYFYPFPMIVDVISTLPVTRSKYWHQSWLVNLFIYNPHPNYQETMLAPSILTIPLLRTWQSLPSYPAWMEHCTNFLIGILTFILLYYNLLSTYILLALVGRDQEYSKYLRLYRTTSLQRRIIQSNSVEMEKPYPSDINPTILQISFLTDLLFSLLHYWIEVFPSFLKI